MSSMLFPPLNVLCVLRGFDSPKLNYKITPYRVEKLTGEMFRIKEVRRYTTDRQDSIHNFVLRTENNHYLNVAFDAHKLKWYLVSERNNEGIETTYY